MSAFRFEKMPMRANDRARRYRVLRGEEREHVGEVEVGGDAPDGDAVVLTVDCLPTLLGTMREKALDAARRFVDELAAGWGRQVAEVPGGREWEALPGGSSRVRIEYQMTCAAP